MGASTQKETFRGETCLSTPIHYPDSKPTTVFVLTLCCCGISGELTNTNCIVFGSTSLDECTPIITPTDSDFVNKKEKKNKLEKALIWWWMKQPVSEHISWICL